MLIIIKNIPPTLNKHSLADLLKFTVADSFWLGNSRVVDVHMVQAENRRGGVIEYHCLAMVEPEAAAKRVIRVLTGRLISGVRLKVEEYVVRCWRNERRQDGKYQHLPREERVKDRRRYLRIRSRDF